MNTNEQSKLNTQSTHVQKPSLIVRRELEISEELRNSDLHPLLKKIFANRGDANKAN